MSFNHLLGFYLPHYPPLCQKGPENQGNLTLVLLLKAASSNLIISSVEGRNSSIYLLSDFNEKQVILKRSCSTLLKVKNRAGSKLSVILYTNLLVFSTCNLTSLKKYTELNLLKKNDHYQVYLGLITALCTWISAHVLLLMGWLFPL